MRLKVDLTQARGFTQSQVSDDMTGLVQTKPHGSARQKRCNTLPCRLVMLRQSFGQGLRADRRSARKYHGTHDYRGDSVRRWRLPANGTAVALL